MSILVNAIKKQQEKGHSPIVLICGKTGNLKTLTGLSIALQLDPEFADKIKTNFFVDIKDFISKVRQSEGEVLIIDEAGIHLFSKKWQSDFNIFFYQVIQTQRHRRNIYIIILPIAMSLAKDHRRMIDFMVEMIGKMPDPNDKMKALYGISNIYMIAHRHGALVGEEIKRRWLYRARTKPPPQELIKAYQEREHEQKKKILDVILKKLNIKPRCICGAIYEDYEKVCKTCGVKL